MHCVRTIHWYFSSCKRQFSCFYRALSMIPVCWRLFNRKLEKIMKNTVCNIDIITWIFNSFFSLRNFRFKIQKIFFNLGGKTMTKILWHCLKKRWHSIEIDLQTQKRECTCAHTCAGKQTQTHFDIYLLTFTYAPNNIRTQRGRETQTHIDTHKLTRINTHTHTHTQTHTHTHTHIYTYKYIYSHTYEIDIK